MSGLQRLFVFFFALHAWVLVWLMTVIVSVCWREWASFKLRTRNLFRQVFHSLRSLLFVDESDLSIDCSLELSNAPIAHDGILYVLPSSRCAACSIMVVNCLIIFVVGKETKETPWLGKRNTRRLPPKAIDLVRIPPSLLPTH